MKNFLLLLVLIHTLWINAYGTGKPFSHHYTPKDYKGDTQNWGIVEDSDGIIYFANQKGVYQYDGSFWRLTQISNNSTIRSLVIDKNDRVWVGAVEEFGYLEPNEDGEMVYRSIINLIDTTCGEFGEVWSIHVLGEKVYFLTDRFIFCYSGGKIKHWRNQGTYFYLLLEFEGYLVVQEIGKGLQIMINDSLVPVKGGKFFSEYRIHSFFPLHGDTLLIGTREQGLFTAQLEIQPGYGAVLSNPRGFVCEASKYLKDNVLYHGICLASGEFAFATIRGGIMMANKKGVITSIYNRRNSIKHESCYYLMQSHSGVLWAALDNGLAKIEMNTPIYYWDDDNGLKGTVVDIIKYKGDIYTCTGVGAFYLKAGDKTSLDQFVQIEGSNEQAWCFLKIPGYLKPNDTILLAGTSMAVYRVEKNRTFLFLDQKDVYKLNLSMQNSKKIFAGLGTGFAVYDHTEKGLIKALQIKEITNEVRSIAEDSVGNVWISVNYRGVARVKFSDSHLNSYSYELFDTLNGLPNLIYVEIQNVNGLIIFATSKGLYTFDEKSRRFIPFQKFGKAFGDGSVSINRIFVDGNHRIWMDGKVVIKPLNGSYIVDSIPFRRLPPSIVEGLFAEKNGNVWIGCPEGLFLYSSAKYKNFIIPFKTLIREVSGSYGAYLYKGYGKPIIPNINYKNNSIVFHFSAPFFEEEQSTEYSFILEGFDSKWSNWNRETKKEYTNLFEGSYKFKVKARNIFGTQSSIASFEFQVLPPWYRSYWAYIVYLLLSILMVSTIVVQRTKRILKEKEKLEKVIEERTCEINNQKEELFSQAEQLQIINTELEKLSIVVRETANAVSIFDAEGNFLWINEGFTRMYGYTLEQFKYEKASNIFDCDISSSLKQLISNCIKSKRTVIYDFFTTTRIGEGVWSQTTLTPIISNDGEVSGLVAIDSDITRLKDAEQEIFFQKDKIERQSQLLEQKNKELEKLSIVARETDNAIIIMDQKGNFEWVNEAFTRMYDYTLEQLIDEKSHNIVGASANLNIRDLINVWYGDKKPINYESQNTTRDGRPIWAQTTLTPILDRFGNISKMVAIDTDITRLKEAQTQIEHQRNELEKANATKDKFFSIIAHDLRSPFSSILSLLNITVDEYDKLNREEIFKYLLSLQEGAVKTFNLLENLLDWSRIQKGEIRFTPNRIDLTTLVHEGISLHSESAKNKNITISSSTPDNLEAFADENMVRTIVRNLISNAVKFSYPGSEIKIAAYPKENIIEVKITDLGIGISEEDLTKLFRIDIHHTTIGTQKEKGTGLGLMLCKEFVERNLGSIWVESQLGKGSTFYFTLPSEKLD